MLAVIGGSGLTELAHLDISRREIVRTPYGEPSSPLVFGQVCGQDMVFLPRHGYGHTIPPHQVNYRANLWALKSVGVSGVVSVASVGAIRADLSPGELVIPNQVLDYTSGRASTYFDGTDGIVRQIDFTEPYDTRLRHDLLHAAQSLGEPIKDGAVYAVTQGPRLETAAEINRLEKDGADIVGMTGMPEAVLARELDLPYATICLVANFAAGRRGSAEGVRLSGIQEVLKARMGTVRAIIEQIVGCPCAANHKLA